MNLLDGTVSPDGRTFILSDGLTLPLEIPQPQWGPALDSRYSPGAYSADNLSAGCADEPANAGIIRRR